MAKAETLKTQTVTGHHWITFGLISILFMLRIPLVTGSGLLLGHEPGWVTAVYELGTYLIVAILLFWESYFLQDYHITDLAIWMIILFKPMETLYLSKMAWLNSPLAFPKIPSLFIWIIALVLFVRFRSRLIQKEVFRWRNLKWLLLGVVTGLATVLMIAYPMSLQIGDVDPQRRNFVSSILIDSLTRIPQQIGYAAVSEEPVFRGFLWGYLLKIGWRDVWIWLFQAGLFVFAHLYYINTAPISFWFIVPLGALVLGWLAWRSRSIATSMVAHGVINGLGSSLGYLIAIFRM